jgi:tRNA(Ile)-lysidine synthetase-like protein
VGVSGGPDSMALVYLLDQWIRLKNGKLSTIIFDHNIRNNSEKESYEVKDMLKKLNIETLIIKAKKNKYLKKNMAIARTNRFEGLINFCIKNNILHLFLGHHFDDNLETYLIRKINGSNLEGLDSMNKITHFNNIQIIRPFIHINKKTILFFNQKNKLKYITDPSNEDIGYTRVKVRNFLLNKDNKKLTNLDLINLKKEIPNYKKMIWEQFFKSLCDIQSHKIKISFDKLIKNHDLIIEKHILIILKFFSKTKYQTRSSKINILIAEFKKPNFKMFNLSGVLIKKYNDFVVFSQK